MRGAIVLLLLLLACTKADEERARIQPKNPPADAAPAPAERAKPAEKALAASPCPTLVVKVRKDGSVWTRDPSTQRLVAPCAGAIDRAALSTVLCSWGSLGAPDCRSIEVAAETGVAYQQIIQVMDAAVKAGFPDVGLTEPAQLSLSFREPADPTDWTGARCQAPFDQHPELFECPPRGAGGSAPPALPALPSAPAADLKSAPVIAVPATGEVMLDGAVVATAKEAASGARIEGLFRALKARPRDAGAAGPVILQVDRSVDAALINRLIATAKAAGHQDVLFAVKSR